MRGKLRDKTPAIIVIRITPADAGKTAYSDGVAVGAADHPRGCGENANTWIFSGSGAGSPPRMRGKRFALLAVYARKGITPADAGKTMWGRLRIVYCKDHPRGCGENSGSTLDVPDTGGSPPRMRGKQILPLLLRSRLRITPADAGKTCKPVETHSLYRDHPRGCGENRLIRVSRRPATWITPADAGKTKYIPALLRIAEDHPRGCGENTD